MGTFFLQLGQDNPTIISLFCLTDNFIQNHLKNQEYSVVARTIISVGWGGGQIAKLPTKYKISVETLTKFQTFLI